MSIDLSSTNWQQTPDCGRTVSWTTSVLTYTPNTAGIDNVIKLKDDPADFKIVKVETTEPVTFVGTYALTLTQTLTVNNPTDPATFNPTVTFNVVIQCVITSIAANPATLDN